jgi:hypothetical protein
MTIATSAWVSIGPALIAGGIGLTSAFLSYFSARQSIARSAEDATVTRTHQRDLLVWERRLSATEIVWLILFDLERSKHLSDGAKEQLVRSIVWLPEPARRDTLSLVVQLQRDPASASTDQFAALRTTLTAIGSPESERRDTDD